MSVRTVVVSDISGEADATTITVGHAGQWHEVDLTEPEKDELETFLQPYMSAGRLIGPSLAEKKRVVPETTVEERAAIRDWGHEQGYEFAGHGRIPMHVYNAYMAAHPRSGTIVSSDSAS